MENGDADSAVLVDVRVPYGSDELEGWRRHWVLVGEGHLGLELSVIDLSITKFRPYLQASPVEHTVGIDHEQSDLPLEKRRLVKLQTLSANATP